MKVQTKQQHCSKKKTKTNKRKTVCVFLLGFFFFLSRCVCADSLANNQTVCSISCTKEAMESHTETPTHKPCNCFLPTITHSQTRNTQWLYFQDAHMLDLDPKQQLDSVRLGDISYQWKQLQRRSEEETVQINHSRRFFFLNPTAHTGSDATDKSRWCLCSSLGGK